MRGEGEGVGPSEEVARILERALAKAEEGEWEEVVSLVRDGVEEEGEDPYLLAWWGMAERELGMEGVAYERFKRCLALEPEDPVILATVGNALAAFDDPAAEAALRTAALMAPDLPQARWMYGAYLAREGFLKEGVEELEAAALLSPDDPLIRTELGVALALGDRMEGAALAFALAAEQDPEDGWVLILLGLARVMLDEVDEGARALEEGSRLRPADFEAQLLAALALAAEGWEDRALEMLERARLYAAEEADTALLDEVESRLEDGPTAARTFLEATLAPISFRERLMARP